MVNKDGTISDVSVLKDIGGGCGKEAVRVVLTMPRWSPGEANGQPVRVRFTLPVRYRQE
ncbi:MAG: energy transducer TonB [Saprospiraceae bacterium]|nr:energy transducer TonB [Saprospiraceae bacterium]